METNQSRGSEGCSETKIVVYMPTTLYDELVRRAESANSEGYSRSKVVRMALREYFRRHPETKRAT